MGGTRATGAEGQKDRGHGAAHEVARDGVHGSPCSSHHDSRMNQGWSPKLFLPPAEGATDREAARPGGWEPLGWEQGLEFSVLKGPVSSGSPE